MPNEKRLKQLKTKHFSEAARTCKTLSAFFKPKSETSEEDQASSSKRFKTAIDLDLPTACERSEDDSTVLNNILQSSTEISSASKDSTCSEDSPDSNASGKFTNNLQPKECETDICSHETCDNPKTNRPKCKSNLSKHKVGYQKKWEKGRPWLKTESVMKPNGSVELGMFCALCRKHKVISCNGSNVWSSSACTTVRLDKVLLHERSVIHLEAISLESETRSLVQQETFLPPAEVQAIIAAMKTAKLLLNLNMPLCTTFKPIVEFAVQELHSPDLSPLFVAGNAKYNSTHIQKEFVQCMSHVTREALKKELADSPAAALMVDETTDTGVRKHLATVVRYIREGEIVTTFFGDVEIPNGTASAVIDGIQKVCQLMDFPLNNFQAIGTDGASAMVGCSNGAITQLKQMHPTLIPIHCMNHRLALAAKDSFKGNRVLDEIEETRQAVYIYYHYSSKKSHSLKQTQTILKDLGEKQTDVVSMKQGSATRWMSQDNSASSLRRSYNAVCTDLENACGLKEDTTGSGPTAEGLLKKLKIYKTYYSLYLMCDVLGELTSLNLYLERNTLSIAEIQIRLKLFYANLRKLKRGQGFFRKRARKTAQEIGIVPCDETEKTVNAAFNTWIAKLIENVEKRFEDLEVVFALSALDLSQAESAMLSFYGDEDISVLAEYFSINENQLQEEWGSLKELLKDHLKLCTHSYVYKFIMSLEKTVGDNFKNVKYLVAIALILPMSTAPVERIFSQVKEIVSVKRNRLGVDSVSDYLFIKFSNSIDFSASADRFMKSKSRRISISTPANV